MDARIAAAPLPTRSVRRSVGGLLVAFLVIALFALPTGGTLRIGFPETHLGPTVTGSGNLRGAGSGGAAPASPAVHYSTHLESRIRPQASAGPAPGCPANSTLVDPSGSGLGNGGSAGWYPATACYSMTFNPNGSITYCLYNFMTNMSNSTLSTHCTVWLNSDFGTFCAPLPPNVTIGYYGLNLTVYSTPTNGTGLAPLNFSWNASANGGGLPPYHYAIFVSNELYSFDSSNATGNVTLTGYGLYEVDVIASDSTCTQHAFVSFPIQVYGPLGPNPVSLTPTVSSATVPSNVTYSINASVLPANWTVEWTTPGIFSSPSGNGSTWNAQLDGNYTYLFPGSYGASACFVQPDGVVYACGSSPTVTLGGSSPVTSTVAVPSTTYPTNVTYTVSVNPGVWLPNGTYLYLFSDTIDGVGIWNSTTNSSVSLVVSEACGYPYTPYVPASGNCTWPALFSFHGQIGGVDAGFLGEITIYANLTSNISATAWSPSLSLSYGPMNGSLPLNFTLNLTATGGVAPYVFSYTVLGRTSGAVNASFLPPQGARGGGWNGSTLNEVIVLNSTGVYWIQVFVSDSEFHWVDDSLPLVVLGNVSPLAPLRILPKLSAGVSAAEFSVAISGGAPPYAIQWAFGDGSYASSIPGEPVTHVYQSPGDYFPSVTVRDAHGHSLTEALQMVHIAGSAALPRAHASSGAPLAGRSWLGVPFPWLAVAGVAGVAALLLALGLRTARESARRDGERLISEATGIAEVPVDPPADPR